MCGPAKSMGLEIKPVISGTIGTDVNNIQCFTTAHHNGSNSMRTANANQDHYPRCCKIWCSNHEQLDSCQIVKGSQTGLSVWASDFTSQLPSLSKHSIHPQTWSFPLLSPLTCDKHRDSTYMKTNSGKTFAWHVLSVIFQEPAGCTWSIQHHVASC